MKRILVLALALASLATSGCIYNGPVPWWKGIPARVIAPNSLEAESWRDEHGGSRH